MSYLHYKGLKDRLDEHFFRPRVHSPTTVSLNIQNAASSNFWMEQ